MALGRAMESEIREQPLVLAREARSYYECVAQALKSVNPELVVLVARGSSDNAALYARYLIEVFLGIPVSLAAPSVLTRYHSDVRYPPCLAIGISQSGAAPDVCEVLTYLRGQGHFTLSVTNTPGSRVETSSDLAVDLAVGEEESVAATKTYTASLVALYQVVRALGAALPDPLHQLPTSDWVETCRERAEGSLGAVLRSERWFTLARGFSFASASETALKMMECGLLPFKSYSTADFQHGPRALATHGSVAVVFGDVPTGLESAGCLVEKAPQIDNGPLCPVWEVIYAQWLALLAARARGLDPDRPPNLKKVTETL